MVRTEKTRELAKELPEYYPIAEGTGNYKLLEPVGIRSDIQDELIDQVRLSTNPVTEMAPELIVGRNQTHTIHEDEGRIYRQKTIVEGDLIIEGELYTSSLEIADTGSVEVKGDLIISATEFLVRLEKLAKLVGITARDGESVASFRARVIAEFALMTAEGTPDDVLDATSTILDVSVTDIEINDRIGPGEVSITAPAPVIDDTDLSNEDLVDALERLLAASYSMSLLTEGTFTYISPSAYDIGDHDPDRGYDGLDANGDPKDNGGTYAGVI